MSTPATQEKIDQLIEKHLENLARPPFKSSIEYFLETGKVSGSFRSVLHNIVLDYAKLLTEPKREMSEQIEKGTPVVAKYGYNSVLQKPFEFLYEFGYYTENGCVVYIEGERNMQDSYAFKLEQIREATSKDLKNYSWGY